MKDDMIPSLDYENLKKHVGKLRTELSMLVLELDELQYMECPNIEMAYMLELGALEYQAYEAQCLALRLRRKLELLQAKRNRQEPIVLSQIEKTLDEEFSDYQKKLDDQIDKMNAAIERSNYGVLSEEESKELKKRYRQIVKALHPDLNPNLSEAQKRLFHNAVTAYKNGDLKTLRIIHEMFSEAVLSDDDTNAMSQLTREKERLMELLQSVKDQIIRVKSMFPYTMKALLGDSKKLAEHKAKIMDIKRQYEELCDMYSQRVKELMEG